jgi:hypothetical protein
MEKYAIDARLQKLITEAEGFLRSGRQTPSGDLTVWSVTAISTLTLFLPETSALVEHFRKLSDTQFEPPTGSLEQALGLLRVAVDINLQRRDDVSLSTLREDMRTIIGDIYLKAWWFYVPAAILLLAAGFAVTGLIQVKDVRLDLQKEVQTTRDRIEDHRKTVEASIDSLGKRAQTSADEARQAVERKLEGQLQSHVDSTKRRIDEAADRHLDTLKRSKSPALESGLAAVQATVMDLEKRAGRLKDDLSLLQASVGELRRGLEQIDTVAKTGALDRLSVFLSRSRQFVVGELIVVSACVVMCGIMLIVARRRSSISGTR